MRVRDVFGFIMQNNTFFGTYFCHTGGNSRRVPTVALHEVYRASATGNFLMRNPLEAALSKRSASAGDDISEGSEEGKSMNMQEIFSETIEILLQMLYNITA